MPEEAQKAIKDFLTNPTFPDTIVTVTMTASSSYNDGVFRYSNGANGLDVVIDTGWDSNEDSSVNLGVTTAIDLWLEAILAPDPQAHFDALPEEVRLAMAISLSDDSIFITVIQELNRIGAIEIEIP